MISFRITADVRDDRRVVITLPPEVPTGTTELIVMVERALTDHKHREPGLADWAEMETGRNGKGQGYPLRGSVVRYDQPTEPIAETDWEALQ